MNDAFDLVDFRRGLAEKRLEKFREGLARERARLRGELPSYDSLPPLIRRPTYPIGALPRGLDQ